MRFAVHFNHKNQPQVSFVDRLNNRAEQGPRPEVIMPPVTPKGSPPLVGMTPRMGKGKGKGAPFTRAVTPMIAQAPGPSVQPMGATGGGNEKMMITLPDGTVVEGRVVQRPAPAMGQQICKDFENGVCNRGAACKFAHVGEPGMGRGDFNATPAVQAMQAPLSMAGAQNFAQSPKPPTRRSKSSQAGSRANTGTTGSWTATRRRRCTGGTSTCGRPTSPRRRLAT